MNETDLKFLQQAIEVSKNSAPQPTCYRVGAVLVDVHHKLISTGYTLEFGEGWHAEASAIKKAKEAGINIKGATIYSSIEPCSIRKSGKKDCSALLIEEGIARVVFALSEPPIFVVCEGENKLKSAGIIVEHINNFDHLVKEINQHVLVA